MAGGTKDLKGERLGNREQRGRTRATERREAPRSYCHGVELEMAAPLVFPHYALDGKPRIGFILRARGVAFLSEKDSPMRNRTRFDAFTLIELLIVVAIIAILAAIAVPNFLEAQVRSKVSRAKADMRTCATAIEAYYVDANHYPYDGYYMATKVAQQFNYWQLPLTLSTPIAYITNVNLEDPFRNMDLRSSDPNWHWQWKCLRYTNIQATWGIEWSAYSGRTTPSSSLPALLAEFGGWRMVSAGPDRTFGPNGWPGLSTLPPYSYPASALPLPYDATNGTNSNGDIIRSQIATNGYVNGG